MSFVVTATSWMGVAGGRPVAYYWQGEYLTQRGAFYPDPLSIIEKFMAFVVCRCQTPVQRGVKLSVS